MSITLEEAEKWCRDRSIHITEFYNPKFGLQRAELSTPLRLIASAPTFLEAVEAAMKRESEAKE